MKIHEWKNQEINRLLMEKFNLFESQDAELNEDWKSEAGHIALDVVGIFPELGEGRYCQCYLVSSGGRQAKEGGGWL